MRTVSFLLLLAGAGLVAPAGAQPVQPAPEASPIVVQGVHDRDKQIRNFIRDLTPAPVHGQLSRFDSPICPAVAGLSTAQASAIAERMRRVAAAVGIGGVAAVIGWATGHSVSGTMAAAYYLIGSALFLVGMFPTGGYSMIRGTIR